MLSPWFLFSSDSSSSSSSSTTTQTSKDTLKKAPSIEDEDLDAIKREEKDRTLTSEGKRATKMAEQTIAECEGESESESMSPGEKFMQMSEPFFSATKSIIFFAPKVIAKTMHSNSLTTSSSTPALARSPSPPVPLLNSSSTPAIAIEQAPISASETPQFDELGEDRPTTSNAFCIPRPTKTTHAVVTTEEREERKQLSESGSPSSAFVGILHFLRTIPKVPERLLASVHNMGRSKSDEIDSGPLWLVSAGMYDNFVERIHDKKTGNLGKIISSFIEKFDTKRYAHTTRIIEFIEAILQSYEGNFEWILPFDRFWVCLEKYIMEKLYSKTFACESSDLEEDIDLFNRISTLQFITLAHLDISTHVPSELLTTTREILFQLNSCSNPLDKLVCVLQCCKLIFELLATQLPQQQQQQQQPQKVESEESSPLTASSSGGNGADEFLPILIYVLLKANPPNLASHIQYISRFHTMASTRLSELNYYFISLVGAVTFIRHIDSSSLSIDPEEFQKQMKVTEDIYEPLVFKQASSSSTVELRRISRYGSSIPPSTSPVMIATSSKRVSEDKSSCSSFERDWVMLQHD